jgi:UDP-N-acetylmuramate dehydrogenase
MNAGAHGSCLADVVDAIEVAYCGGVGWVDGASLHWGYRRCELPEGALVSAVRLRLHPADRTAVLEEQRALLRKRRQSQPRGVRTFGSVFKNPDGDSAGRLLEEAGVKGLRRGGAEVSSVHANFLVNLGDATTGDMLTLMALMREAVYHSQGILLEPEVKLIGTRFPWQSVEGRAPLTTESHG